MHRWFLAGAAVAVFGFALPVAAVLWVLVGARDLIGLLAVYGSIALGAAGGLVGAAIGRSRMRRIAGARTQRSAERNAVSRLSVAGEGVVRVRGRIRPLEVVVSVSGVPCLAFEQRGSEDEGALYVRTRGGRFEIDDGSGLRATVRAQYVVVTAGVRFGDELLIPLEGDVEIVGRAHIRAASDDSHLVGPRMAARAIEIDGTTGEPLIVRLLGPLAVGRVIASPRLDATTRP